MTLGEQIFALYATNPEFLSEVSEDARTVFKEFMLAVPGALGELLKENATPLTLAKASLAATALAVETDFAGRLYDMSAPLQIAAGEEVPSRAEFAAQPRASLEHLTQVLASVEGAGEEEVAYLLRKFEYALSCRNRDVAYEYGAGTLTIERVCVLDFDTIMEAGGH